MYAIMRVEKRKRQAVFGLQIENNRKVSDHQKGRDFDKSNIDWERTSENRHFKGMKSEDWNKTINEKIKTAGAKARSDSVVMIDALYTASPDYFKGKTKEEQIAFFTDCVKYHIKAYGNNIINAVVHWDESAPHLHIASVPLVQREKGAVLSAKELLGNRDDYRKRQDEFYELVGKPRGLERGERTSPEHNRKHEESQKLRIAQNQAEIDRQERFLTKVRETLDQLIKTLEIGKLEHERLKKHLEADELTAELLPQAYARLTEKGCIAKIEGGSPKPLMELIAQELNELIREREERSRPQFIEIDFAELESLYQKDIIFEEPDEPEEEIGFEYH